MGPERALTFHSADNCVVEGMIFPGVVILKLAKVRKMSSCCMGNNGSRTMDQERLFLL
jgi:hypothetical protein